MRARHLVADGSMGPGNNRTKDSCTIQVACSPAMVAIFKPLKQVD